MQRPNAENEKERLWFLLFGLFIFIVIAWLQRLNWIEPIERAMAMSCHNMFNNTHRHTHAHTKCRSKRRDIRLKKSSNPWISYSFCSIACYQFQATVSRSFSMRCHANRLKEKNTLCTMSMAFHSIHEYPVSCMHFPKRIQFRFLVCRNEMSLSI